MKRTFVVVEKVNLALELVLRNGHLGFESYLNLFQTRLADVPAPLVRRDRLLLAHDRLLARGQHRAGQRTGQRPAPLSPPRQLALPTLASCRAQGEPHCFSPCRTCERGAACSLHAAWPLARRA